MGASVIVVTLSGTQNTIAQNLNLNIQDLCRTEVPQRAPKGTLDPDNDMKVLDPGVLLAQEQLLADTRALGQNVFVDFDSGTDGSIVYTAVMRDDIIDELNTIYQDFGITFFKTAPAPPYSTVTLNSGGPGGLADNIDFRNLNFSDTAVANLDGLGFVTTADIVQASANLVAHEFGHLLGLRHADSYGAIGDGISPNVALGSYLPSYPGPQTAVETNDHIMTSPASVGSSVLDLATQSWLSERNAIKIQTADIGTVVNEVAGAKGTVGTAQPVALQPLPTPNTIVSGANAGLGPFNVRQVTILGALGAGGEVDMYAIDLQGGPVNIEVISVTPNGRYANTIDSQIRIFDGTSTLIPYYASTAYNDDELEGTDSTVIDIFVPAPATYYLAVQAFNGSDTGNYELYVHELEGFIPDQPVGNGQDPQLRSWNLNQNIAEAEVWDLDPTIPDVTNMVQMTNGFDQLPEFEYDNGVYYANEQLTGFRVYSQGTGAIIDSFLPAYPNGADMLYGLEVINGTLYAITGSRYNGGFVAELITIDPISQLITPIGSTGVAMNAGGLAHNAGQTFTTDSSSGGSTLYSVNLGTGAATPIAPLIDTDTGSNIRVTGLEFGMDDLLYALSRSPNNDYLYVVDPATGFSYNQGPIATYQLPGYIGNSLTAVPRIAPVGNGADSALKLWASNNSAYDIDFGLGDVVNPVPQSPGGGIPSQVEYLDGNFYVGTDTGPLAITDASTGSLISSTPVTYPVGFGKLFGMEFVGGTLYATLGNIGDKTTPAPLATVDPITGTVTVIGTTSVPGPTAGLAYYDGVMYTAEAGNRPSTLYTVNPATGATIPVGPVVDVVTDLAVNLTGLEFGVDGVLYGLSRDPVVDQDEIFAIDPATGFAFQQFDPPSLTVRGISLAAAPVAPAGFGIDPELKLWNYNDPVNGDIFDVVFNPTDVANPLPVVRSGSLYAGDFDYKDGSYYVPSSSNGDPAPMDIFNATSGALQSTLNLVFPAGYVQVNGAEFVGDTLYTYLLDTWGSSSISTLATIDLNTGNVTVVGASPTIGSAGAGLAWYAGTMYTAEAGGAPATLSTVNTATGVATPVGAIIDAYDGKQLYLTGLEFGADGVLYGLTRGNVPGSSTGPDSDRLYSIDHATGIAYPLGALASIYLDSTRSLAITSAPIDPQLRALDGAVNEASYTVDTHAPAAINPIPFVGVPGANFYNEYEHAGNAFYASSGSNANPAPLDSYDSATGALIQSLNMTFPPEGQQIYSLEFVGSTLYGALAGIGDGSPSYLATIDYNTGAVTTIGNMNIPDPTGGLAYDGTTMYIVNATGTPATLYTVNLVSGLATPLGPVFDSVTGSGVRLTGLEFGKDGLLYGMGPRNQSNPLFIINTVTGEATRLGNLSLAWGNGLTTIDTCSGDLDGDGDVDGADLGLFLATWGPGFGPTDYDNDGDVDGADLGLFLAQWGPCP
jgi:hypothetical protein